MGIAEDLLIRLKRAIDEGMGRTQKTVDSISQGNYPAGQLLADVSKPWLDAADLWSMPFKALNLRGEDTVLVPARVGERFAEGFLHAPWIGQIDLNPTALTRVGPRPSSILPEKISAYVPGGTQIVVVRVVIPIGEPAFIAGTFTGYLHRDDGSIAAQVKLVAQ